MANSKIENLPYVIYNGNVPLQQNTPYELFSDNPGFYLIFLETQVSVYGGSWIIEVRIDGGNVVTELVDDASVDWSRSFVTLPCKCSTCSINIKQKPSYPQFIKAKVVKLK